jgi:hypothetical protein
VLVGLFCTHTEIDMCLPLSARERADYNRNPLAAKRGGGQGALGERGHASGGVVGGGGGGSGRGEEGSHVQQLRELVSSKLHGLAREEERFRYDMYPPPHKLHGLAREEECVANVLLMCC